MDKAGEPTRLWDPFDREIASEGEEIVSANQRVERFIAHPGAARRNFQLLLCIDLLLFAGASAYCLRTGTWAEIATLIALTPIIPCWYRYGVIAPIQNDYARLLAARSLGWTYRCRSEALDVETRVSPGLWLHRGPSRYYASAQFWGSLRISESQFPFWAGILELPQTHTSTVPTEQYVILRLPLQSDFGFSIASRAPGDGFPSEAALRTDTEEFDGHFRVTAADPISVPVVRHTLTPDVLRACADCRQALGGFSIEVSGDKAIFILQTAIIIPQRTGLTESPLLSDETLVAQKKKFDAISGLAGQIASSVRS